ncbi:MAG: DUF1275 domain-containing protein [Pseudomonadota bacterium]|nr:DUF1275 domain-containing protein [Pseudomonadota bacterium]
MTAVAGWVDAVGILLFFTQLQIFPTYMSGNTTRLFVAATRGEGHRVAMYGLTIALFVFGAIGGRLVNSSERWRESLALLAEAALLIGASAAAGQGAPELLTLGLLATAMGWNNMALKPRNGVGPKGYITGTLVSFANHIAEALTRRGGGWAAVWSSAAVWASMACGALAGALSTRFFTGTLVLLVPALLIGLCSLAVACAWIPSQVDPITTASDGV